MMKHKVFWNKTDIATMINISHHSLAGYLSDSCKEQVGFKGGKQRFRDNEVLIMLKDMFPAKNDAEIRRMIGY